MKRLILIIFTCLMMTMSVTPVHAAITVEKPGCKYAYVLDGDTSRVMYNRKGTKKMFPASMTKIMTAYLAMTKITDLDAKTKIKKAYLEDWWALGVSTAYFQKGEKVTYRDLVYGCLFPSGADACRALAVLTYGSEEAFVNAMNETAISLGCKNTHFMNPTGLHDENHYTTCRDLTLILREAMKNKDFAYIFTQDEYETSNKKHYWISSLTKTRRYSGKEAKQILGAKSGYTDEAGRCLVSCFKAHGHWMFMAVGKASTKKLGTSLVASDKISKAVIKNTKTATLIKKDTKLLTYHYAYLIPKYYQYVVQKDVTFLVDTSTASSSQYVYKYSGLKTIEQTINEGDKLGDIDVYSGKTKITSIPLYAYETINYDLKLKQKEEQYAMMIAGGMVALLVVVKVLTMKKKKSKIF